MLNTNIHLFSHPRKRVGVIIVLMMLFFMLLPISSFAERRISLPFSEDFDANNYGDIVWVTNGASHQWLSSGGWQGGGAAKFFPITTDQGYSGLGQFVGLNTSQLNVRFLIRHGPDWNLNTNKVIVMNRANIRDRPMIISRNHNGWVTYGACDGTVCEYEGGDYWPDGTDSFRIGTQSGSRVNEWICVEFEANARTGLIKLYITSQDGELSGLYTQQRMANPGDVFSYIDIIGGYINFAPRASANNYFILDKLAVDDSFIGPPSGFIAGATPPNPPRLVQ
jgi:hypothetical protein